MAMWIGAVVLDSPEPKRLAQFWAEALGYVIHSSDDHWAAIVDPKREHVRLSFQSEKVPKTGSNRLHFDVYAHDMDTEVARLTSSGARQKRENREPNNLFIVMEDPEGNEFCVCQI